MCGLGRARVPVDRLQWPGMIRANGRTRKTLTLLAAGSVAAAAPAGCGSTDAAVETTIVSIPATVAIGGLPEPLSDRPTVPAPPTSLSESVVTTTEPRADTIDGPVGEVATGNRLLMIGDGVLATIAPRFGGIGCDVLPGFGWVVEIAAEPGRFVGFGNEVLDARLDRGAGADWDVVAVMLGNQYDDDADAFERELQILLERLAPRAVVLYTVSEVDERLDEVNRIIRAQGRTHPNVVVVDWAEATAAEPERLLDGDGPAPTPEGSGRLVLFTAAALGEAPGTGEGTCLQPVFVDDSAIVL